ncbi:MAG: hypothetical protein IK068_05845 [Lachnospiraceae bacterium]|nr:hypothetical protein [Lachnospiraceae bacterium]
MKRKILAAILSAFLVVNLCGCGVSYKKPATPIPTEDDEVYETNDKDKISFTSVEPKDYVEPSAEAVTEAKKENGTRVDFEDIDGDGNKEYAIAYEVSDGDLITGAIELYFNNELIYEINHELLIDPGKLAFEDYDGDEEKEIFFSYDPRVNSMPLEEYVVLKFKKGAWNPLKTPVDRNGSNNFPVHIKYGNEACKLLITCDGLDKTLEYDAKAHYENAFEETKEDEYRQSFNEEFLRMLNGEGMEAGKDYGVLMPWGIWSIESAELDKKPVLKAEQGIAGPLERYDFLGSLYIYFTFNENGEVVLEDMEFFATETNGTKEN